MSKWSEFYQKRINNQSYENYFEKKYSPYLSILNQFKKSTYIEYGCGIGTVSKIAKLPENSILTDIDPEILNLAKINNPDSNFIFEIKNAKSENIQKHIGHTHGLLEHFSDKEINQILQNININCNYSIHYVPSYKYEKPSFGDERLLNKDEWYKICKPFEIIEFNQGYDYILFFKNKKINL